MILQRFINVLISWSTAVVLHERHCWHSLSVFSRSSAKGGQPAEEPKPEAVDEPDLGKKNGADVEMAEEATESPQKSGPGFLKRAVSKLWKIPMEGLNGVPYNDIGSAPASPTPAPKSPTNGVTDHHDKQNGNSSVDSASSVKSCVVS